MTLAEIRAKIDAVDDQLLRLLNERADLARAIGELKRKDGVTIYSPDREEQVFQALSKKSTGRLPEAAIRAIYREIMSASLALEKDLTIAYLGPEAASAHQAARQKFGASLHYAAHPSIAEVFNAVARAKADYGVVPVENSIGGAMNQTLDAFMESDLKICAQFTLKIEYSLIAKIPRHEIRKVYSHPEGIGECRQWLRRNLRDVEIVEVSSATRAAELAAAEPSAGAIAGRMAAELYNTGVLETSIQDSPNKTARFLVIGHFASPPTGCDETSLVFSIEDKAGALFRALEPFQRFGINVSKIESRPSQRNAREASFFVEIDGHASEPPAAQALADVEKHCTFVRILGTYPRTAVKG